MSSNISSINCKIICTQDLNSDQIDQMTERIKDNYFVHLLADNLPAVTRWELENDVVQVTYSKF